MSEKINEAIQETVEEVVENVVEPTIFEKIFNQENLEKTAKVIGYVTIVKITVNGCVYVTKKYILPGVNNLKKKIEDKKAQKKVDKVVDDLGELKEDLVDIVKQ